MASRHPDASAFRPEESCCRILRVDLRRARVAELAGRVRQGRYAVDGRRLAQDLLRLEPALFSGPERVKP